MPTLKEHQQNFIESLLNNTIEHKSFKDTPHLMDQLNVYRSSVFSGLITVLADVYKALSVSMQDDFKEVALRYVFEKPPENPSLLYYGKGFEVYINNDFPNASFLKELSLFEWALHTTHYSTKDGRLDLEVLKNLSAEEFLAFPITLRSNVKLFKASYPLHNLYKSIVNRESPDIGRDATFLLIHRFNMGVCVESIDELTFDMLEFLSEPRKISDLIDRFTFSSEFWISFIEMIFKRQIVKQPL